MMSREEIDRHVAGILRLRGRRRMSAGSLTGWEFNPNRRRVCGGTKGYDTPIGEVDTVFSARQRAGWLPRGGRE